jgi:hypothetical protein
MIMQTARVMPEFGSRFRFFSRRPVSGWRITYAARDEKSGDDWLSIYTTQYSFKEEP